MKTRIATLALLVTLLGCEKDKFETKPKIEIKSVNTEVVPVNGFLNVRLEFFDKEGDVDDSLYIWKTRLNTRILETVRDSIPARKIPEFPDKNKGEMELNLTYQEYLVSARDPSVPGNPGVNEPDTLRFKFVIKDKAGNRSDTAFLDNIVIIR